MIRNAKKNMKDNNSPLDNQELTMLSSDFTIDFTMEDKINQED